MDQVDLERRYRTRSERFEHGGFSAEILLPDSAEDLIDEREFGADERLPYWAELWPSALGLSRHLLDTPMLPGDAIEVGCGVGLPSLVLAYRGVRVTATDYYTEALHFTGANALRNAIPPPATLLLDWRQPPARPPRAPLVVAADVLYESRNVEPLVSLLPRLVTAGGEAILADPGRVYLPRFLRRMEESGWRAERLPDRLEAAPAAAGVQVRVQLFRLTHPEPAGSTGGDTQADHERGRVPLGHRTAPAHPGVPGSHQRPPPKL